MARINKDVGLIGQVIILVWMIAVSLIVGTLKTQAQTTSVNDLELGEGRRRAQALTMAQTRLASDQKQVTRAQANVTAAGTDAKKLATANQQLTAAQNRVTADQKTIASETARVADWNTKTLATHNAAGKTIDWTKGTIN